MQNMFNVHLFGIHRITQDCIPDLIKLKGRIVNISSISGIGTLYGSGIYSITKHAIEAYTDALSFELKKFDIHVSAIEPGNYQSSIGRNYLINLEKTNSKNSNLYTKELALAKKRVESMDLISDPIPVDVAEAVYHALFDSHPKIRYLTTHIALESHRTITKAIIELLLLNENHLFSYSLDELLERIKEVYQSDLLEQHYSFIPESIRKLDKN